MTNTTFSPSVFDHFTIFGHRGVAGHQPENTAASIQAAIDLKLNWIEVDVRYVAGELIIFHDRRLERLCHQPGVIDLLTSEQLKTLRIHDQPLLTLNTLFDMLPSGMGVNLEIKGADTVDALIDALNLALDAKKITAEQLLLSSFDHEQLYIAKQLLPDIKRGLLISGIVLNLDQHLEILEPFSVHQSMDFLHKELVKQCQLMQKKIFTFTVNNPEDLPWLLHLGVDGIFTDYPQEMRDALTRLQP